MGTSWFASEGKLSSIGEQLLGSIYSENHVYISAATERTAAMLLVLSELHAGLAVLQSSDFGINFILSANINLGNVIAQLTELVNHGKSYALYNLIALEVIDNLMNLIKWLTPWLLLTIQLALFCLIAVWGWLPGKSHWYAPLVRCSETLIAFSLLLTVIIPLSITLVSYASKSVTEISHHKSYKEIVNTHHHILQNKDEDSIKNQATGALNTFKMIKNNLTQKARHIASNISTYIAVSFLEVFILPIFFSLFIFCLYTKIIKRYSHVKK